MDPATFALTVKLRRVPGLRCLSRTVALFFESSGGYGLEQRILRTRQFAYSQDHFCACKACLSPARTRHASTVSCITSQVEVVLGLLEFVTALPASKRLWAVSALA